MPAAARTVLALGDSLTAGYGLAGPEGFTEQLERHLRAALTTLGNRDIPVLLTGMRAPPNMGKRYAAAFDSLFGRLAERHGVTFYPFFLDGVAAQPALNQRDGIHPNAKGVGIIVERIAPFVLRALEQ